MNSVVKPALALLLCCLLPPASAFGETYTGKVIAVTDGDTIKILHDGKPETIMLADIDCPEKQQPWV